MTRASSTSSILVRVSGAGQADRARAEAIIRGSQDLLLKASSGPHTRERDAQTSLAVAFGDLVGRDSRALLADLRASLPASAGLVLCARRVGQRELHRAIGDGLNGLVWDHLAEVSLAPTLRAVAAGQLVIPQDLRHRVELPRLSVREKQILSLVIMGLSNGEIAARLFIAQTTVKTHLGSAYRKLGVNSRAQAAQLITDPEEGLGTGILRITELPVPARAPSAAPGDEAAGKMADQPYDTPHVGDREP
jgi:DNA-binding NarL/FixJ family response regulator